MNSLLQLILFFASLLLLAFGFLQLTEVTLGVGLIGMAGVLAIYMRIAQAAHYQQKLEELLEKQ